MIRESSMERATNFPRTLKIFNCFLPLSSFACWSLIGAGNKPRRTLILTAAATALWQMLDVPSHPTLQLRPRFPRIGIWNSLWTARTWISRRLSIGVFTTTVKIWTRLALKTFGLLSTPSHTSVSRGPHLPSHPPCLQHPKPLLLKEILLTSRAP